MGVLGPTHLVGRRCDEYPLVQDTISSPLNRSSNWRRSSVLPNYSSSSAIGLENWFYKSSHLRSLRITEVYPKSSHVGHPRSPFKFSAFIDALLFLRRTSGKVFPVRRCPLASELERRTTSEVSFCSRAPTPVCIRGVMDYLSLEKVEGVQPSLMPKMSSMEPATRIRAL
jgi:hypothetical protein